MQAPPSHVSDVGIDCQVVIMLVSIASSLLTALTWAALETEPAEVESVTINAEALRVVLCFSE